MDRGEGDGKSGFISGGKPVLVLGMYWPGAVIREGSFQMGLSASTPVSFFSRRSRGREWEGQWRIACWKDSGSIRHRGQGSSGFMLNQQGWPQGSSWRHALDGSSMPRISPGPCRGKV